MPPPLPHALFIMLRGPWYLFWYEHLLFSCIFSLLARLEKWTRNLGMSSLALANMCQGRLNRCCQCTKQHEECDYYFDVCNKLNSEPSSSYRDLIGCTKWNLRFHLDSMHQNDTRVLSCATGFRQSTRHCDFLTLEIHILSSWKLGKISLPVPCYVTKFTTYCAKIRR